MELSVRSGGHDYVCDNLKNGSLHLDMRDLDDVELYKNPKMIPKKARNTFDYVGIYM